MKKRFICALLICCLGITVFPAFAGTETLIDVNVDEIAAQSGETIPYNDVVNITGGMVSFYTSYRFSHVIQKGVFGKAEEDNSARIYSENLAEAQPSQLRLNGVTTASYKPGDVLEVSFKIAYGVLSGPGIYLTATDGNDKTVLTGSVMQVTNAGDVKFFGANCGTIPNYKTNRWYDYRILIKFGESSVKGSLYIDTVPYGEDIEANYPIRKFTEFVFAYHGSNGKYPAGSQTDTYIDDIGATKYIDGDEPTINELEISSSLECVEKNGVCFSVNDRSITAEEFLESISGNYESIEFIKNNKTDENPEISSGVLRILSSDGRHYFADVDVFAPVVKPGLSYFDVTDFKFVRRGTTVGATANIFNYYSWRERSAVMVMVLKDDAGAVRRVYSSPVVSAYSADGLTVLFPVEIQPVETEGFKPYVFFLSDWDEYLSIKDKIYK